MKKFILATGLALTLSVIAVATPAAADDITKKLQDRIATLSTEQQAALLLLLNQLGGGDGEAAAAPAAEAAPAATEKSVEELAKEGVQSWVDAAKKGDIDGMMSFVSEDFEHYEYGDKAGLRDFLQQAQDMGYLEDLSASMEDTEIENEDDGTVILYPVDIEGMFGALTFEFVLKKEDDGKYRMVGMDVSGL